jgi:predicted DNA-binding antitoxin AbrB/MazE fold protein
MENVISAIYEGGVLRPLEPIPLKESEVVSLSILRGGGAVGDDSAAEEEGLRHRDIMMAFIKEMEALPDNNPHDGFSNRDHDRLIYGE